MIDLGDCCFHCDECPIIEGLEHRLKTADECGELQLEYCGCDKIGYEFFLGGYCSDAISRKEKINERGKRKTGDAYRRRMCRVKNERAIEMSEYSRNRTTWVPCKLVDGEWVDGNHLQHVSRSNRRRYYKKSYLTEKFDVASVAAKEAIINVILTIGGKSIDNHRRDKCLKLEI